MGIPVMPTNGFEVREAHRDSSTPLLPSPASHLYYSSGGRRIVKFSTPTWGQFWGNPFSKGYPRSKLHLKMSPNQALVSLTSFKENDKLSLSQEVAKQNMVPRIWGIIERFDCLEGGGGG